MKKIFLVILFNLVCLISFAQKEINIFIGTVTTIDNFTINMKIFFGKKIIIATFDASKPDTSFLMALDSVNRVNYEKLAVLVIPVIDFGLPVSTDSLISLVRFLHLSIPVIKPVSGKRGENQFTLLKWITTTSRENHFNIDLQNAGNIYFIGSNGVLYGIMPASTDFENKLMKNLFDWRPIN